MEFILNSQGGYISFANLNKLHVNTSIDILNDFLHGGGSSCPQTLKCTAAAGSIFVLF